MQRRSRGPVWSINRLDSCRCSRTVRFYDSYSWNRLVGSVSQDAARASRSARSRTQERTDGVLPYFEDDRLGVPLCVFVFDRHIVAFAFRKQKEKTAHSGDDGQRNRLPNPQAGVLPVADGGYLRIRPAEVSCGKFAFVDCFARFVVEGQMSLVSGIESSE